MENTHSLPEKFSTDGASYELNYFNERIKVDIEEHKLLEPIHESEKYKYSIRSEKDIEDCETHSSSPQMEYEEKFSISVTSCETEEKGGEANIDIILNDIEIELIEEETNESNPSTFCEVCTRNFASESVFINHQIEGLKCGSKRSKNNSTKSDGIYDLEIGLSTETIDGKIIHDSTGLDSSKKHEKVREEEKPFKCKICPKSFVGAIQLKYHEKIHKKILEEIRAKIREEISKKKISRKIRIRKKQKFQCRICWKDLYSKKGLVYHEKIHTEGKPFQCKICLKHFTSGSGMKYHKKKLKKCKPPININKDT